MGVWIGDGTFRKPEITTADKEVVDYILGLRFENGVTAKLRQPSGRCQYISITLPNNLGKRGKGKNLLWVEAIRAASSGEKRIQREYLVNSRSRRLQLLAGIVDTDGCLGNGYYEIITQYDGLAKDIEFLARSLGFQVTRAEKHVQGYAKVYWRINICGNIEKIPVKIARKKAKRSHTGRDSLVEGFQVESLGRGMYCGFTLDGDGQFLLGDFTVTHNTASLSAAANAGWKIRYLDFDGNADPLVNFTEVGKRGNIEIVSCLDKFALAISGGGSEPEDATPRMRASRGWAAMTRALNKWPTDESFAGDWEPTSNILVIDSATTLATSKVNAIQHINKRGGTRKNFNDYELTQTAIEGLLQAIKADIRCPVFITAHLQLLGPDLDVDKDIDNEGLKERLLEEKLKGASKQPWTLGPITLGKAQARTLAGHFSGTALIEARPAAGRVIKLKPIDGLALGLPIPGLKDEYPIESGWATILEAWKKNLTPAEAAPTKTS